MDFVPSQINTYFVRVHNHYFRAFRACVEWSARVTPGQATDERARPFCPPDTDRSVAATCRVRSRNSRRDRAVPRTEFDAFVLETDVCVWSSALSVTVFSLLFFERFVVPTAACVPRQTAIIIHSRTPVRGYLDVWVVWRGCGKYSMVTL